MSLVEPLIPPPSVADRAAALQAAGGAQDGVMLARSMSARLVVYISRSLSNN
jgi:hypothetical protein